MVSGMTRPGTTVARARPGRRVAQLAGPPPGGPAPDTAAVELLIEHDIWPRRRDFLDAAVARRRGRSVLDQLREARDVYDRGDVNRGSTTERAVLDLALSLGDDRYRLTQMGRVNSPRSRVRSAGRSRHDHAATGDSRRGRRSRRGTPLPRRRPRAHRLGGPPRTPPNYEAMPQPSGAWPGRVSTANSRPAVASPRSRVSRLSSPTRCDVGLRTGAGETESSTGSGHADHARRERTTRAGRLGGSSTHALSLVGHVLLVWTTPKHLTCPGWSAVRPGPTASRPAGTATADPPRRHRGPAAAEGRRPR